ncbi:hypothetical protein A3F45_01535 [Candidatus Curtissbacteria bacterium RIFCSPHIGHO2_12_FULL_41_17]|uniref:Amidohydrolase 3 domain-containing protein n=1 Tax=Candidatus Curtissbacteria bacterium RIFCSPHIGHO2_12_FULL_41_17 TaxID=1797722 RepID=A0A1F5HMP4_9BACT|nr:MAG: hypothetical protein A3F45_01535 [Candidatus Curtissbacteria bacterium RIFCSPHIGHO2_12_FULL_41_17]
MAENSSEQGRPLTHFQPEVAYSPEKKGPQTIEIVADPVSGEILKSGDPRDVRLWIEAERSRAEALEQKPPQLEVVRGGLLIPGLVDAHAHPFIYSGLKLHDPIDASQVETKENLIEHLREKAKEKEGGFLVATDLQTGKIRDLTREDLDRVSAENVVVYDPSYHGCVVNTRTLNEARKFSGDYERVARTKLRGEILDDGHLTEDYVYMTWEMIEAAKSVEELARMTKEEFDRSLRRGVTSLHDLELGTYNEVIAYLLLRKEMGDKFPVRRVFVQPRTYGYMQGQMDELRRLGLADQIARGEWGLKLYADGSFGTHTAMVSSPYADGHGRGAPFFTDEQLNGAIRLAREEGLDTAIHAIGDSGIQRALRLARQWRSMDVNADDLKFRIEHFELPTPTGEVMQEVSDLGIWVTPQPNFLLDYVYSDRLGERVKMLCPHREMLGYTDRVMFGTDGMPTSMLFAVWLATHAPEKSQRLNFEQALLASSLTAAQYEGENRGKLVEGQKADIIVADRKLEDILLSSAVVEDPREVPVSAAIDALEKNIQKVYLRGELVHSK